MNLDHQRILSGITREQKLIKNFSTGDITHSTKRPKTSLGFLSRTNHTGKIPPKFDVLNLIIESSPGHVDLGSLSRKMQEMNKTFKKISSNKDKLFYRYNVLYGSNSTNLIRTYSPKMRPMSASVDRFSEEIDFKSKESSNAVFSEEDIDRLFVGKCFDINVEPKIELRNRFFDYVSKKCINRVIELNECNLGKQSINILSELFLHERAQCYRVNLSKNNLGDYGASKVVEMINKNTLVEVDLSSNNIGPKGGEIIFKSIIRNTALLSINISSLEGVNRNRICSEGIKCVEDVLKQNHFLEYLNVGGNSIKAEGLRYIVNGLINNSTLKFLDISRNDIDESGIKLFKSIVESKISSLNLSQNPIGNEGVLHLANAIMSKSLGMMRRLNISECKFNCEGLRIFLTGIRGNHRIVKLALNNNNLFSSKFLEIQSLFNTTSIKHLSMNGCGLNKYAKGVAMLLSTNNTMKYVDLSYNQIDDRTFISFSILPKSNGTMRGFDLSRNFISDHSAKPFFTNIKSNSPLRYLNFYDNQIQNVSANILLSNLRTNHNMLKINFDCNRVQMKIINDINALLSKNKDSSKRKFIPKIKSTISTLKLTPNLIPDIKKKIEIAEKEKESLMTGLEIDVKKYNKLKEKYTKKVEDTEKEKIDVLEEIQRAQKTIELLLQEKKEEIENNRNMVRELEDSIEKGEEEIENLKADKIKAEEEKESKKKSYEKEVLILKLNCKKAKTDAGLYELKLRNKREELEKKKIMLDKVVHPEKYPRENMTKKSRTSLGNIQVKKNSLKKSSSQIAIVKRSSFVSTNNEGEKPFSKAQKKENINEKNKDKDKDKDKDKGPDKEKNKDKGKDKNKDKDKDKDKDKEKRSKSKKKNGQTVKKIRKSESAKNIKSNFSLKPKKSKN